MKRSRLQISLMSNAVLGAYVLGALLVTVGCKPAEPTQQISFNEGRMDVAISEKWVLQRSSGDKMYFKHSENENMRLAIQDQTRDLGQPMTVAAVKGSIGSELNMRFGGVTARLSYGGNALLDYGQAVKEGRNKLYTHNWVVARPYGYGAIARVAITLKVPHDAKNDPAVLAVKKSLDKHIGDATMPEA